MTAEETDIPDAREEEEAFLRQLKPDLEQMEILRQMKFDQYKLWSVLIWPVGIAAVAAAYALDYYIIEWLTSHYTKLYPFLHLHNRKGTASMPIPILSTIALILVFIKAGGAKNDFVLAYKQNIVGRIAQVVGLSHYHPKGGIPLAEMAESRILPAHDQSETEDYFEGEYKDAHVRFCQVKFSKTSVRPQAFLGGRRNRNHLYKTVPVFKGLALLVTMPHPICTGHTILVKDRSQFTEWLDSMMTGLKKVELVNPGMDRLYTAFSNNADEARQLITADLLSRVHKLSQAYESKGVSVAFYQSQMFILVGSDKDFFEPPDIRTSAAHTGIVLSIKREVSQVVGLIDYLTGAPQAMYIA